jgi:hypothetical protein
MSDNEFDPNDSGHVAFLWKFDGRVQGVEKLRGIPSLEFPNMYSAASWVEVYDYQDRARIINTMSLNYFSDTVVIAIYPPRDHAAYATS